MPACAAKEGSSIAISMIMLVKPLELPPSSFWTSIEIMPADTSPSTAKTISKIAVTLSSVF